MEIKLDDSEKDFVNENRELLTKALDAAEHVFINGDSDGELNYLEQAFNIGDVEALIEAIALCGSRKIIMPEWVVKAISEIHWKLMVVETRTLDEAFNFRRKKGFNLRKAQKWKSGPLSVYLAISEQKRQGRSIDADEIAKDYCINRNDVWEMYKYFNESPEYEEMRREIKKMDSQI